MHSHSHSHSSENLLWPFKRRASTISVFRAILLVAAATRYMNVAYLGLGGTTTLIRNTVPKSKETRPATKTEYPLQCATGINETQTCPTDYPTTFEVIDPSTRTCPDYFKWIHEDLRPWKSKGITREMVEAAKPYAFFRLAVVDGKVYWEKFHGAYQTRDVFTIWGILQLLRLYPGELPDLDIIFEAGDVPVINRTLYAGPEEANAPPMFHYCGDDYSLDISLPRLVILGLAQNMGKAGSKFVRQELEMDNVYDYMFHLLNEYGKLLKYKPTIPPGATQTCSEMMDCQERGLQREFRLDNMVKAPSKRNPCILSPPQDPQIIQAFLDKQDRTRRKVDSWVAMGKLSAQDTSS